MLATSGEDYSEDQLLDSTTLILCRTSSTDKVSFVWNTVLLGTDLPTTKKGDEDGRSYLQIIFMDWFINSFKKGLGLLGKSLFTTSSRGFKCNELGILEQSCSGKTPLGSG